MADRCHHIEGNVRCTGRAYTPDGLCIQHADVCEVCGFAWPNCDCEPEDFEDDPSEAD